MVPADSGGEWWLSCDQLCFDQLASCKSMFADDCDVEDIMVGFLTDPMGYGSQKEPLLVQFLTSGLDASVTIPQFSVCFAVGNSTSVSPLVIFNIVLRILSDPTHTLGTGECPKMSSGSVFFGSRQKCAPFISMYQGGI